MGDRIGVQLPLLEIYLSLTNHPGQLSLAIPLWVGAMSTGQRAVMLCDWGVKADMVLSAGNTVWSISERVRGVCVNALYKSTFTLLLLLLTGAPHLPTLSQLWQHLDQWLGACTEFASWHSFIAAIIGNHKSRHVESKTEWMKSRLIVLTSMYGPQYIWRRVGSYQASSLIHKLQTATNYRWQATWSWGFEG